jgi:hypothetical protein
MTGRLQWLDAAAMKGGASRPDQGWRVPPFAARKYGRQARKAASGAPGGERVDRKTRARHSRQAAQAACSRGG